MQLTDGAQGGAVLPAQRRSSAGLVVTPRDREWLLWLDRVRYSTSAQLAARHGTSFGATRVRLSALVRAGLVEHRLPLGGGPACLLVTGAGAAAAGSTLPRPSWDAGRTAHTLSVAEAVSAWERRGVRTVTEAEVRRDPDRWLVAGHRRPDLVLTPSGGPVAVEVERARKSPGEYALILGLYGRCPVYAGRVLWLAAPGVAAPLNRVVTALEMQGTVRVHEWGTAAGRD